MTLMYFYLSFLCISILPETDRFKANIDKYGEGLADFLSKTMQYYADKNFESNRERE